MDKRLVVPKKKKTLDKQLKELALDEDVLYWIFNKCSLRDCIRMRVVCKSWFSVSKWITGCNQLPWLMMLSNPNSEPPRFFRVFDNTIYDAIKLREMHYKHCCGSFNNADARGWLMTTDIDSDKNLKLFHPWRRIEWQLPDILILPNSDSPANYLYYTTSLNIRKAAMSDDAAAVAIIYNSLELAFCRIGDEAWTIISSDKLYYDVIYHKGQFFVVAADGSIGVIRINTTHPYVETLTEKVETQTEEGWLCLRIYLVADSAGDSLFILMRNIPRQGKVWDQNGCSWTIGFKVYELRVEKTGEYKKNLVEVESLGDRVIFLGQNSSVVVMASQFPGFKGNRIYFTNLFESPGSCLDLGIFDMEDKTTQPLFPNGVHPTFSLSIWIAPPL